MTRRAARPGEYVVSTPGREPIVDECQCGKRKVSYVPMDDRVSPPQIDIHGIKHFFDGSACCRATREEWEKVSTYPFPFVEQSGT